MLLQILMLNKM